jgi:hypothetical protein
VQKLKLSKILFVGTKAFMQIIKKGNTFLIYVLLTQNYKVKQHDIPLQYQTNKDVFEKKC